MIDWGVKYAAIYRSTKGMLKPVEDIDFVDNRMRDNADTPARFFFNNFFGELPLFYGKFFRIV